MDQIEFRKAEITCPLPQGLLNRWKVVPYPYLYLYFTSLDATGNSLCGRTFSTDPRCHFLLSANLSLILFSIVISRRNSC